MQTSVECPVCTNVYAPRTQPPKLLITCGHGLCEPCVRSLLSTAHGSTIDCPKCRTKCDIPEGKPERLPTNYQILELIDTLCGNCRDRPHTQRCGHCPLNLCDDCRQVHMSGPSVDVSDGIKQLEQLVVEMYAMLADKQGIQDIKEKGVGLTSSMNQDLEEEIRQLKAEHAKKIAAVDADVARNIDIVIEWRRKLRQLCTESEALLETIRYTQQPTEASFQDQDEMQKQQLKESIAAVKNMQYSKPDTSKVQIGGKNNTCSQLITQIQFECQETQTDDVIPRMLSKLTQTDDVMPRMLSQQIQTDNAISPVSLVPDYSSAVCKATFNKQVTCPVGVCEDKTTGLVISTDYSQNKLLVLTPDLQLNQRLGGLVRYKGPWGIVVNGNSLYVSDQGHHRIHVTNLKEEDLYMFGSKGSGSNHFNTPCDLSIDASGNLYVCDAHNKRVKVVDTRGTYIREFGSDVLDGRPWFNAISADNKLAVTTHTAANIYLFTTGGQHMRTIRTRVPPHNIQARGVTFDGHGHLLVSDDAGGRVAVMTESGDVVGFMGSGQLKWPSDLIVTKGGDVIVCDRGNKGVHLFGVPMKAPVSGK